MFIATVVVSALLAVAFTGSGVGKLAQTGQSLKFRDQVNMPAVLWRTIGVLEIAGVVGLLAGLAFAPLGIAAATGTALLTASAVVVHGRAKVLGRDVAPAIVLFLLSVAAVVLRSASS